ncbi:hypothetical protein K4A83_20665 [Spirulina subsalsa FACHB-351]|uniref:Uncharacterized protein n=1 Tax=Spirulina subsalsa FACHB-351 TaxID=234711 RepID=A0ABT3LC08_9CYAN|nr:hypothetical protein [Spirulina subsalsa]MCW6038667.1 hypothetical protein [Spirulina subsalsa FACHB-351]
MLNVEKNNNNKNTEEYLYDLLERIKQRPGMYLGRVSLTRLKMLLLGYGMSRGELGLQLTQQEKQFSQFQKWIQEKYDVKSSEGWENIILSQVDDERLAFELFFELFEQFSCASLKG